MERLNKLLAQAGIASRRGAERLIGEGRVRVNGHVVRDLGTVVDPVHDVVKVGTRRIRPAGGVRPGRYLMLHKPRGVVTTLSDPEGRPTVRDLVPGVRGRLFPVGRLDLQSEGLLLLTDDGELARELMHPSRGIEKVYHAKVRGVPDPGTLRSLARGVRIEGDRKAAARVRPLRAGENPWLEVTVTEGRKHLVRRLLAAVGHPVVKLRRVGFAGLALGSLAAGASRPLRPEEVTLLRRKAAASPSRGPGSRPDDRRN